MAEIHLCGMGHSLGGPSMVLPWFASLGERDWPGGGRTPILKLSIGYDYLEIWPADKTRMRELGEKLIKLSEGML